MTFWSLIKIEHYKNPPQGWQYVYTLIGQMCNPYTRLYAYQTIIIWWVSVHYILCQLRAFSWWCEKRQGIASHPKWNFQNTRKEWLSETLRTLDIRINEPCWDQVQLLCPPGAALSHRRGPATIWWKSENCDNAPPPPPHHHHPHHHHHHLAQRGPTNLPLSWCWPPGPDSQAWRTRSSWETLGKMQ